MELILEDKTKLINTKKNFQNNRFLCYSNSINQILLKTLGFSDFFYNLGYYYSGFPEILSKFSKLFVTYYKTTSDPINQQQIFNSCLIKRSESENLGSGQQDSQEYLSVLLNNLNESIEEKIYEKDYQKFLNEKF